jgi:hypothetical protein
VGSAAFVVVLLALTQLPAISRLSFSFRCLLFAVPAVAGASGAAIRVLWDNWDQPSVPLDLRPIGMTIALGFWAAGAVAALFLLEQIWVLGTLTDDNSAKLFGVRVSIGLLAGLTLNRVFPKLIQSNVPVQTEFSESHGQPIPARKPLENAPLTPPNRIVTVKVGACLRLISARPTFRPNGFKAVARLSVVTPEQRRFQK